MESEVGSTLRMEKGNGDEQRRNGFREAPAASLTGTVVLVVASQPHRHYPSADPSGTPKT